MYECLYRRKAEARGVILTKLGRKKIQFRMPDTSMRPTNKVLIHLSSFWVFINGDLPFGFVFVFLHDGSQTISQHI